MIAGARVDIAPYKQHPADFVLWKPSKPGEPVWDSPWGPGRPGWHIECSAMIEQSLGLPIDIHGGGNDLIFPHHENEMAQGLCAGHAHDGEAETEYAKYWLHNGFLTMDDEKMSKTLGNVALVHDLVTRIPGEVIRFALLVGHYHGPLDWTDDLVDRSRKALNKFYGALERAQNIVPSTNEPSPAFLEALEDDLNTPQAFAVLHALASTLETGSLAEQTLAKGQLLASGNLIGFLQADPNAWFQGGDEGLKARINQLITARIDARAAKDWPGADRIRDELTQLNVEVMDSATGATWRFKELP
jgi:cysteinyl-tRNA synthetase